jgi:hypothetical protein
MKPLCAFLIAFLITGSALAGGWLRLDGISVGSCRVDNVTGLMFGPTNDLKGVAAQPYNSTNDWPTTFTPIHFGHMLAIHTTTQKLYFAMGTTTNDWVLIYP